MTGYLLDTDVVSLLAPDRTDAPSGFLAWLERMDAEGRVFLSIVAVHELHKGIALLDGKGASSKAARLRVWVSGLLNGYADKLLGLDPGAAGMSGLLEARAITAGHSPGMADAMVAGIAQAHGLVVVTRNARHFLPFDVEVLSPEGAVGDQPM